MAVRSQGIQEVDQAPFMLPGELTVQGANAIVAIPHSRHGGTHPVCKQSRLFGVLWRHVRRWDVR
jgi:hypothetical protein